MQSMTRNMETSVGCRLHSSFIFKVPFLERGNEVEGVISAKCLINHIANMLFRDLQQVHDSWFNIFKWISSYIAHFPTYVLATFEL